MKIRLTPTTLRSSSLAALLALGLALPQSGCGSSSSNFNFTGGNSGGSQVSPVPGTISGKVFFAPVADVEEADRSSILLYRSQLENTGSAVSNDGRFVATLPGPASGWTLVVGDQTALVDVDGTFSLQNIPTGVSEGIFRHPSDPNLSFRLRLDQLAPDRPVVLPVLYAGSCGMQEADTDTFCGPRAAIAPKRGPLAKLEGLNPLLLRPQPRIFHEERQMKAGPLGSEPNISVFSHPSITQAFLRRCPDVDGLLRLLPGDDPIANDPSALKSFKYFFSTCNDLVSANACLNENKDADKLRLATLPMDLLARFAGPPFNIFGNPPLILDRIPAVGGGEVIHCYQNHKHRNCAQINIGDVVCQLPDGTIVKPAGGLLTLDFWLSLLGPGPLAVGTVEAPAGTPLNITIHNNGAFGITKINQIRQEAGGQLLGDALVRDQDDRLEIHHYLPVDYVPKDNNDADAYVPDIRLQYSAPINARRDQMDSYVFLVDDRYVVVNFKVVPATPFLRRLGSNDEVDVRDLNAAGTLTTVRNNKTYLEVLNQEPVELIAQAGEAMLNDDGTCLYQANDHQSHAQYRTKTGDLLELTPPAGSLSAFAEGVSALSPQGFYFCKAKRADGKTDFFTQVQGGVGKDFLNAPEGLAPSTEVTAIPSTTREALWGNCPPGTVQSGAFEGIANVGVLARYDFTSRVWQRTVVPPRTDLLPSMGTRYVDANANDVLTFSFGNDFSPASPPAGVTWFSYFNVLIQTLAPFNIEQESKVEGLGSRTVFSTAEAVPGGPTSRHQVVGLNEAGEVAGSIQDATQNKPVIFPLSGGPQDIVPQIASLAGFPTGGSWRVRKISGRFMILEHIGDTGSSLYLWFRGPEN